MVLDILTKPMILLLLATTTSQYMPPPSFTYQFQQGQPPMPSMSIMPMPNGGQLMPMPNGAPMMPPMMPHMPRLPGMLPPPMSYPIGLRMTGGRLPMVVRPQYSKKADKPKKKKKSRKHKRKRISKDSASSEESCSLSAEYRARNALRSSKKRREVLTPVVSYVTRDGYVVYQKKIKKEKAKDWLEMARGDRDSGEIPEKMSYKDMS